MDDLVVLVLENDERVDVLVARTVDTVDGVRVAFEDVWSRRRPLGEAEEEESRSLIRWFRRRYPTPADRLAYVRRAYRRWTATQARP